MRCFLLSRVGTGLYIWQIDFCQQFSSVRRPLPLRKRIRSVGPCCVLAEHLSAHSQLLKWLPLKLGSEEDLSSSVAASSSPGRLDESSYTISPINLVWRWDRLAEKTQPTLKADGGCVGGFFVLLLLPPRAFLSPFLPKDSLDIHVKEPGIRRQLCSKQQ